MQQNREPAALTHYHAKHASPARRAGETPAPAAKAADEDDEEAIKFNIPYLSSKDISVGMLDDRLCHKDAISRFYAQPCTVC